MMQDIQDERVSGFREFANEVRNGIFPDESRVIKAKGTLIEDFLKNIS